MLTSRFARLAVYALGVNLNLSVFWTLVVVVIGAPLLAAALLWGTFLVALFLGYNPEEF
jgi:hypothetical protein